MSSAVSNIFSNYKHILIACLIIIVYLSPYFILGEDTHIRHHDNLDSNIVWYKLLAESGQFFSMTELPNVINGLPRSTLATPFDFMVWLYVLFEPMTAYTIGQTIMRFAGFFGMYLLLRRFIGSKWIITGVALTFALLPFWPSGWLSIAGLPLALYLFLSIRDRGWQTPWYHWLTLMLIPFFSSFILTFVFFLGLMGVLWLVDWVRLKQSNWALFTATAAMSGIYLIKNYMVLYSMFINEGFTSHREELNLGHNNLSDTISLFFENFLTGHTHDMAIHTYIILPIIGIALVVATFRRVNPKWLIAMLLANVLLSLWYAFWYWEGWRIVKDNFMIANTFNFSRIHFLDPMIWYIALALALWILWKHIRFGKTFVILVLIAQTLSLFWLNEEVKYDRLNQPTYAEFYSEELFESIEDYIGREQSEYRVVSIAMHPTVAQFNGFYTLDTYNNSFPLEYKHQFREIIAPELAKNASLENYFDTWGGRIYMYVAELGENYIFTKNSDKTLDNLDINTDALNDMGGDYVLSALPIENHDENQLAFERSFENNESIYKIYLYRVESE
ncbi:DUF6044 family protein [Lentibacillus amyloliquefaciens]|uniref:Glycosyltransferase RgtA/B/C/D-like domain-containing protein n=1 Tax=Lentibacillus amyloliquefaciens TaxID=1472767 RepID=A0A0U4F9J5_9BACI|nr:DUF6044 family protein [Lentibacillus amyloliquefaciens]ALX50278.1 hypothetical protein AOX59_17855 [Lentibacillus amyloliquefaciens]